MSSAFNLPCGRSTRRGFLKTLAAVAPALFLPRRLMAGEEPAQEASAAEAGEDSVFFVRRDEWHEGCPDLGRLRDAETFTRMTVHHEGNAVNHETRQDGVREHLGGIVGAHLQKRYGDIGYHFVIDYAGRIWEGRSLLYEGSHVARENAANLGVMLLGNFEKQEPSERQIKSLSMLTELLLRHYPIARDAIFGHCDLGSSACPGRYLYSPYIHLLRKAPGPAAAGGESASGRILGEHLAHMRRA